MRICLFCLAFLGLAFAACAEDRIFLYGDFYAGMSREELLKSGPAQCDDYPDGKTICNRQRIRFSSMEWTQFFEFKNNGLTCVAFGQPMSMRLIDSALAWFMAEKYVPINLEAGRTSVDFNLLYNKNEEKFQKQTEEFNRFGAGANRIDAFLVKQSVLKNYRTMDKLPENAVVASLAGSKRQGLMFVTFELAKDVKLERRE